MPNGALPITVAPIVVRGIIREIDDLVDRRRRFILVSVAASRQNPAIGDVVINIYRGCHVASARIRTWTHPQVLTWQAQLRRMGGRLVIRRGTNRESWTRPKMFPVIWRITGISAPLSSRRSSRPRLECPAIAEDSGAGRPDGSELVAAQRSYSAGYCAPTQAFITSAKPLATPDYLRSVQRIKEGTTLSEIVQAATRRILIVSFTA